MYAGHVGIALGLRRVVGAPPLWLLVLASQGPDWCDAVAELLGLPLGDRGKGPHSIAGIAAGTLAVAAVGAWRAPGAARARAALVAAGAYAAHWACDFVTGHKPTWPGGPVVGLDLYRRPYADFVLEAAVVVVGWALWRQTLPRPLGGPRRAVAAAVLPALLVLQALANRAMANGGRLR